MSLAAAQDVRTLRPQPGPQEAFCASPADVVIYGGKAGGGKTYGLLLEPLRHRAVPGFRAVFFRRTYPRIVRAGGMWDESEELYEGLATPVRGDLIWRFPSGSRFEFAHLQHERDRLDWKGAQIPYTGWDQLEEFTEAQFWYLMSRSRSTCGVRPYVRATCNPVPPDDEVGGWLARLIQWWWDPKTGYVIPERCGAVRWFVREGDDIIWADTPEELTAEDPERRPQSLTFIEASLDDNPALEARDPSYRGKLMALPRVDRQRLLGGNWLVRATAGDYFQRGWFDMVGSAVRDGRAVRAWDLAGTRRTRTSSFSSWTAGVLTRRHDDGSFTVEHVERFQGSPGEVKARVIHMAHQDGEDVVVRLPQDPGQAGKAQVRDFTAALSGFTVRAEPVTGAKTTRAGPASSQAEAGNMRVVRGEWNEAFFRELEGFPEGTDDQVDALADGMDELTRDRLGRRIRWSAR